MELTLVESARRLAREVSKLEFGAPVTHVYNPLDYAWQAHQTYLERYGSAPKQVVLVGMNPGPWGMAQTGVPFGEVAMVRDWLGIEAAIEKPDKEHPKRPVEGFDCTRSEVSGSRLWGWARSRFARPEVFFERFFVANYCPLSFMESSGRNRTPDKLPVVERAPLLELCDRALAEAVSALEPEFVVGIGKWAEGRLRHVLDGRRLRLGGILHPSPASPRANRGWAGAAELDLAALGIRV